jgi:hypothetical protein
MNHHGLYITTLNIGLSYALPNFNFMNNGNYLSTLKD